MKNVLVIGSTGQIGSELTMKIRNMYPDGNVVAGYIKGAEPKGVLLESGPAEEADVCNGEQLLGIVVRTSRSGGIARFSSLVQMLAELVRRQRVPGDVQVWTLQSHEWRRYRVLPGGAVHITGGFS